MLNKNSKPRGKYRLAPEKLKPTILAWVENRDQKSANLLAREYWGLARSISNTYAHLLRMDAQELFCLALRGVFLGMQSYQRVNYDKGHKLTNFVGNAIRWEISRHAPQIRYRIKMPANNIAGKISKGIDKLGFNHPLNFEQTMQLAEHLGQKASTVQMVYMAMQARDISQGTPVRAKSLGMDATLEDKLEAEWPSPEDFAAREQLRRRISRIMLMLKPQEERILRLRFGIKCQVHTYEEVAQVFDVTRERIRQMEAKALEKLRHPAKAIKLAANIGRPTYDHATKVWTYPDNSYGHRFGELPYQ